MDRAATVDNNYWHNSLDPCLPHSIVRGHAFPRTLIKVLWFWLSLIGDSLKSIDFFLNGTLAGSTERAQHPALVKAFFARDPRSGTSLSSMDLISRRGP